MSGIEDVVGPEVWRALDQAEARRRHVRRVVSAFTATERWQASSTARRGLAAVYTRDAIAALKPTIPGGWVMRQLWDRDAIVILPAWLAWLGDAWRGRFLAFRLAMRLGLWRVKEGDYYAEGHVTAPRWLRRAVWCFLNDRDEYPRIALSFASRATYERFADSLQVTR